MAMGWPVAEAHVHVQVGYAFGVWDLHVLDFESGRFSAAEYPLGVGASARQAIPNDIRYQRFLGSSGSVWILPQVEVPGLLNLGIGTSGVEAGLFSGNQIRLELHGMEGPGHMALFTVSAFGSPVVHWSSRDGVSPGSDAFSLNSVNGHVHVNWAFTQPGIYRLSLAASGTLALSGQSVRSPLVDYTFVVEEPSRPVLEMVGVREDRTVELRVAAPVGTLIQIQAATQLGQWVPLGTVDATGQPQRFSAPPGSSDFQFFRAFVP